MIRFRGRLLALALVAAPAGAQTTINFDDGTNGLPIGAFYSGLGVTFDNARWDAFVSPNEAAVGAGGLKFVAISSVFNPKVGSAIVARFAAPLTSATVRGLNVGANGARVDAYDALVGGALVAFDQAFGIDLGVDNHPLLSVAGAGIRRLEFYQPASVSGEGLLFDNLTFTTSVAAVPEPATVALLAGGLAVIGIGARRRRSVTG